MGESLRFLASQCTRYFDAYGSVHASLLTHTTKMTSTTIKGCSNICRHTLSRIMFCAYRKVSVWWKPETDGIRQTEHPRFTYDLTSCAEINKQGSQCGLTAEALPHNLECLDLGYTFFVGLPHSSGFGMSVFLRTLPHAAPGSISEPDEAHCL